MATRLDESTVRQINKELTERFGDPIVGPKLQLETIEQCSCGGMMEMDNTTCSACGMMPESQGSDSMHENMLGEPCRECRMGTYQQDDGGDPSKVYCDHCGADTDLERFIDR